MVLMHPLIVENVVCAISRKLSESMYSCWLLYKARRSASGYYLGGSVVTLYMLS